MNGSLRMRSLALSFVVILLFAQTALADQPRFYIDWPASWEFQQRTQGEQPIFQLRGRQRVGGRVLQELSMTVISTNAARVPVTHASIEDLANRLRNRFNTSAAVGELQSFANARGYYFVVTDSGAENAPRHRHLVEGVMLDSGYFVDFALQSNDASSPDTLAMLRALADFTIR